MTFEEDIVDRYIDSAVTLDQKGYNGAYGGASDAVKDISLARNSRIEAVVAFIINYKVHRAPWKSTKGIKLTPSFSEEVAAIALKHFDQWQTKNSKLTLQGKFKALVFSISQMYYEATGKHRSFLSLSSKLLWLFHPSFAPIYDKNASQALLVLNKCSKAYYNKITYDLKDVHHMQKSDVKAKNDSLVYNAYTVIYADVYTRFRPCIEQRLALKYAGEELNAFAIFDKVLWLLGSEKHDVK